MGAHGYAQPDGACEVRQLVVSGHLLVAASAMEIYNEQLTDLAHDDAEYELKIREHPKLGVFVQNQVCVVIDAPSSACQRLLLRCTLSMKRQHYWFGLYSE